MLDQIGLVAEAVDIGNLRLTAFDFNSQCLTIWPGTVGGRSRNLCTA